MSEAFSPENSLTQFRDLLDKRLSSEDQRSLCFDLGIDYDNLAGDIKRTRFESLLRVVGQAGRGPALIERLKELRPHSYWPEPDWAAVDWQGLNEAKGPPLIFMTDSGAYVGGDVDTRGGAFIGRDYTHIEQQVIVQELTAESIEDLRPDDGDPPFKGLQVFTASDAPLFFGRDNVIAELVDRLHDTDLLAVVGASGCGKSSVVRAGVIPALTDVRPRLGVPPPDGRWQPRVLTPTSRPLDSLAAAIYPLQEQHLARSQLRQALDVDAGALAAALGLLAAEHDEKTLLVVDQFEEIFTQTKSEPVRRQFIDCLLDAASDSDPPLKIILTVRADFYAECLRYEQLKAVLQDSQAIIGAMSRQELRSAIVEPAALGHWQIQEGLVELMLDEVAGEPGALPLLSHALYESWERRRGRTLTLSGYKEAGGVRGAIAHTAEATYSDLPAGQQQIVKRIFLELTELGEGAQDTRRRATAAQLAVGEAEGTEDVLQILTGVRLVTAGVDDPDLVRDAAQTETFEVAHEAVIREWPRLQTWLEENRDGLRLKRQIEADAAEWVAHDEEPGYLFRGARLANTLEFVAEYGLQLGSREEHFLAAAREAEALEKQRQEQAAYERAEALERALNAEARRASTFRRALIVTGVLLIVAIVTAALVVNQSLRANNAEATAVANLAAAVAAESTAIAETTRSAESEAEARDAQGTAEAESTRADLNAAEAQAQSKIAAAEAAEKARQAGIAQSRALAASSRLINDDDPMRSLLLAIESGRAYTTFQAYDAFYRLDPRPARPLTLLQHNGPIQGASWNKDHNAILTWSDDSVTQIWSAADGSKLARLAHDGRVMGAAWSEDGTAILTWDQDGIALLWPAAGSTEPFRLAHDSQVEGALWNGDGTTIMTWDDVGNARVWSVADGSELIRLQHGSELHEDKRILGAAWNRGDTAILTWSQDGSARIWSAVDGVELTRLQHDEPVFGARWSRDETMVLTWSRDWTARVWSAGDGRQLNRLDHSASVLGALWNKDETFILTWSADGVARIWSAGVGDRIFTFPHSGAVESAQWSEDETIILTSSEDGTARLWSAEDGSELLRLRHGPGPISGRMDSGATWSQDEKKILTWNRDDTVRIWSSSDGKELIRMQHDDRVGGAQWNDDETAVLSWSADGAVRIWSPEDGLELRRLQHGQTVAGAQLSNDELALLTWSQDRTARIWSVIDGVELVRLQHDNWVAGAIWSEDETAILSWTEGELAGIWSVEDADVLTLLQHDDYVTGAIWNKDETEVLTWSEDGTVRVWSASSGDELLRLWHDGPVLGATWNMDETAILTWSEDGTAMVSSAEDGSELIRLEHDSVVMNAAWNADQTVVMTWGEDRTVRLWSATDGSEQARLEHLGIINDVVWNTSETAILVVGQDGIARVWSLMDDSELFALEHDDGVTGAIWNADETIILSWSEDGSARLWSANDGAELYRLQHDAPVEGAIWNEDESAVLTWIEHGAAYIWSTEDGSQLFSLLGDGQPITVAGWLAGDSEIMLATEGGNVLIYAAQLDRLLEHACSFVTRNLTWDEFRRYLPGEPYEKTCTQPPVHCSVPVAEWPAGDAKERELCPAG